ncbi:hypothetical protein ACRALDRAFT_2096257 [Sodiomyces alcalophilus JCM 7366]|uniref:uncharacterized protein n=1 Tax=Sodiomyces alcalophilus JCM 7366 TaxID=591952 RepID=UPI0039B69DEF
MRPAGPVGQFSHSATSDTTDRVFPIRSVVSVDPVTRRRSSSQADDWTNPPSDHVRGSDTASSDADRRRGTSSTLSRPGPTSALFTSLPDHSGTHQRPKRSVRSDAATGRTSSTSVSSRHLSPSLLPLTFQQTVSDNEENSRLQDEEAAAAAAAPSPGDDWHASNEPVNEEMYTTRFRHVMTEDGHAVITGREEKLQRCEDEPIHTPGAIQAFGLLVALREEEDGRLLVRYTSENSGRIIGYSPQRLFQLSNFLDILTDEQQDNLLDHIDFIRDEDADPAVRGSEIFSLSVRPPMKKTIRLWCAIHINRSHPDLIICEFELDDDLDYPLRPPGELVPEIPEGTLQSTPTQEELAESTEILSKPLRVLRSARRRRAEAGAMQVFDIMTQIQEQLASATTLDMFLKILVGIIKELTGFHRVMIYKFDSAQNGKVVTELVDTAHTLDLYKGLQFPASDIPKQARDLYKLNKVRLLYDRDLESARLVCRSKEDLDTPLDMSHSYLRAMSPIHVKYLENMAVRSSMSISITAFDELWGLIACHSYGPKGMRVSFPVRKMCRLIGDTASRNIERLSYVSRLQARKLIKMAPTDKNPSGYIAASSDDLFKLFDADFGLVSIQGESKILGKLEQTQEALAMLEYLRMRQLTAVTTSQDIRVDFPDLHYPPGFSVIAGLLYVPLSVAGDDFIVFFRKGQAKEVKWAGNPYDKTIREGTKAYLEPRKSFSLWREMVFGKCREWSEDDVETAAVLCLVYGKFIEVRRQREAAMESSRLTQLLLANSAHEVRTPLNAIINYLEIALEGTLDQETRDNLAKSHSASKSLIYVINDLLDLTKTEEGKSLVTDQSFDLSVCLREATDMFAGEAKRKGIEYNVVEHPGLPRSVYGDGRRVRQAISNVVANAVQHTSAGMVQVELYVTEVMDHRVCVEIVVQDTGIGMSSDELDTLFRYLEQVGSEAEELSKESDPGSQRRTLGLGLAVVARVVRNMDGQLRLKSEKGQGSRFVIQLPFDLPDDALQTSEDGSQPTGSTTGSIIASVSKPASPGDGEITLIDRGTESATGLGGGASQTKVANGKSSGDQEAMAASSGDRPAPGDAERPGNELRTTPPSLGVEEAAASQVHAQDGSYDHRDRTTAEAGDAHDATPTGPPGDGQLVPPAVAGFHDEDGTSHAAERDLKARHAAPSDHPQSIDSSSRVSEKPGASVAEHVKTEAGAKMPHATAAPPVQTKLHVLVAEDDPINMKIIRKRLEKLGHQVYNSVNGEECAATFRETSSSFDVILMDMQMPIVDGITSTKMIRSLEKSYQHGELSSLAARNGRIPIFAVSASLVERERDHYAEAGFDGWVPKPIDFKRLNTLLLGITDDETRTSCLYTEGGWELGGWFCERGARKG